MLVCFGFAWPVNIYKSLKTHATAGKSPLFLAVILLGYCFGIANKMLRGPDAVMVLYAVNWLMVAADLVLYYHNLHAAAQQKAAGKGAP